MDLIKSIQQIKKHFDNQRIDLASSEDIDSIEVNGSLGPTELSVVYDRLFRKALGENYTWADVLTYLTLVKERTIDMGNEPYYCSLREEAALSLVRYYYASDNKPSSNNNSSGVH